MEKNAAEHGLGIWDTREDRLSRKDQDDTEVVGLGWRSGLQVHEIQDVAQHEFPKRGPRPKGRHLAK